MQVNNNMLIVLNVPGAFEWLVLGLAPPDDPKELIGLGMVAYLSEKDPAHIFIHAAAWHDVAYTANSDVQLEKDTHGNFTWPRYRVDKKLLMDCLELAGDDLGLQKEAVTLYVMVREWGGRVWENEITR